MLRRMILARVAPRFGAGALGAVALAAAGVRAGALAAVALAMAACLAPPAMATDKVRVVAATTDLGSIAATVGGERVEVATIARPNADPHRVEVLPSYMVRVARASLYLKVGLTLDRWSDQIVDGSHNDKVQIVDCSKGVNVLDKPTGPVDASMGDVHPGGNPHYWLDPRNGGVVARNIAEALARVDPAGADQYNARAAAFARDCDTTYARGVKIASSLPSKTILTYHRSWTYFTNAFGLEVPATVEPVPGIPPTGRHLQDLVEMIKERKIGVLIQEPYFSADAGQFLNRQTGIRAVTLSGSCDNAAPGSYLGHFEALFRALAGI